MRSLLFVLALGLVAACSAAKDQDGCGLVKCPPPARGVHNIIPNPHGMSSFCCCVSGTPKLAHCPFGGVYDHGSRDCVNPSMSP